MQTSLATRPLSYSIQYTPYHIQSTPWSCAKKQKVLYTVNERNGLFNNNNNNNKKLIQMTINHTWCTMLTLYAEQGVEEALVDTSVVLTLDETLSLNGVVSLDEPLVSHSINSSEITK